MAEGIKRWGQTFYDKVVAHEPLDLAILLTLILLLIRPGPPEHWTVLVATTVLAIVALVWRELGRSPAFWFVVAALLFLVNNVERWSFSDNHKFLTTYWCLAIGCSLASKEPARALALNGRVLIGLVFLLATLWKLVSSTYTDSSMFHFLLISDPRFFPLAHLCADFSPEMYHANKATLSRLAPGHTQMPTFQLVASSGVSGFAIFLTWYTVFIEGLIALLFLLPGPDKIVRWRDAVLLAFIVTTYPPTNVIHFGWVLIILAIAQCPPESKRLRFGYFLSLLFIFCFSTGYMREAYYRAVTMSAGAGG